MILKKRKKTFKAIEFFKPSISKRELKAVISVLKKGWLTMGKKTIQFENNFAQYVGSSYAISVNSCTAALHLALAAIGLKEGDEVIVPDMTFTATAEVVTYFKAKPVIVDVREDDLLMDPKEIEKKITKKTKAIIPVHYGGQPCDMDEILEIAKKRNIFVIEDSAHCLPAYYKGRKIGTISDITCFSFYATKTITTGEGGMCTTENKEWAERIKILRLHGISKDAWKRYTKEGSWEYDVIEAGFKYNMTDIQAAIGIEQLKRADLFYEKRKKIALKYIEAFKGFEGINTIKLHNDRTNSWHLFPIFLNLNYLKISRDEFIEKLKDKGIGTSVHFIPLHRHSFYKSLGYKASDFPKSESAFKKIISLPIYPKLSYKELDYILSVIYKLLKTYKR